MMDTKNTEYQENFELEKIKPREVATKIYSKPSTEVLTTMIQEFGFVEPIILDSDYNIVHGQHRYFVAKSLKLKTVPVIIINTVNKDEGTTDLYSMLADRVVEWNKWDVPQAEKILSKLDNGLQKEKILGYTTTSEKGKWREIARKVGWFINIVPKNLSATNVTLDRLTTYLTKQLAGKYQFDDAQLLYIEALREEILKAREKMIAEGKTEGGLVSKTQHHIKEEEEKLENGKKIAEEKKITFLEKKDDEEKRAFSARAELEYLINEKARIDDTAKTQISKASDLVYKTTPGGKMMGVTPFIVLATTFCDMTAEEAKEFYNKSSRTEFNEYCQKVIDKDPTVPPAQTKKDEKK